MNLDKKEFFSPHTLGDGLKALEQALSGPGGVPTALHALLTVSNGRGGGDYGTSHPLAKEVLGRWAGDRLAIVGDYSEPGDIPHSEGIEPVLYYLAGDEEAVNSQIEYWLKQAEEIDAENKHAFGNRSAETLRSWAEVARQMGPFTDITETVRTYLAEGVDDYYHAFKYGDGGGWVDREFDMVRREGM